MPVWKKQVATSYTTPVPELFAIDLLGHAVAAFASYTGVGHLTLMVKETVSLWSPWAFSILTFTV